MSSWVPMLLKLYKHLKDIVPKYCKMMQLREALNNHVVGRGVALTVSMLNRHHRGTCAQE